MLGVFIQKLNYSYLYDIVFCLYPLAVFVKPLQFLVLG